MEGMRNWRGKKVLVNGVSLLHRVDQSSLNWFGTMGDGRFIKGTSRVEVDGAKGGG